MLYAFVLEPHDDLTRFNLLHSGVLSLDFGWRQSRLEHGVTGHLVGT